MLTRKRLFLLLVVLCVSKPMHLGFTQAADPDNEEKARLEPFRDEHTGLEFADIPGFQRDKVHRYDSPGLGYDVTYHSKQGVRCTIYVFNLGISNISQGPSGDAVKKHFEQAKADIAAAQKQGLHQSATEISSDIVVLGDADDAPRMRRSQFKIRRFDKDWISYIYLTGYKKRFLKIRCTLPADKQAEAEKEFARILDRLETMLTKK